VTTLISSPEILGYPGYKGHANGCSEEETNSPEKFSRCVIHVTSGITVNQVTEDPRVEEGKNLVHGCQEKSEYHQFPIVLQIRKKQFQV